MSGPQWICGSTLRGLIYDNASGKPLARARVSLEALGETPPHPPSVLTDSSGSFAFFSLPAGTYLLKAQKQGYLTATYGQRRWSQPGTPIVLEPDKEFALELRLRRLSAVTGRVFDENELGLPGIAVYAYSATGRRRQVGAGVTDDRGVYRIAGLEPGDYYIRTGARELEDRRGLLPTFYGQSVQIQGARIVKVELEGEREGVDIAPIPGRLSHLTVTLHGPVPATVNLETEAGRRSVHAQPGGTVSFGELAPGPYVLWAFTNGRPSYSAWQEIDLGAEQENVSLTLAASPTLQLRCSQREDKSATLEGISAFLRPKDESDAGNAKRVACGETAPLRPGLWEIGVMAPPEFFVASVSNVRIGKDGFEFKLLPGQSVAIEVTLSKRPARLKGSVKTAEGSPAIGAPVILRAKDEELNSQLGGPRTTVTNEKGEFSLFALPPGRYEVYSSFSEGEHVKGEAVELKEGEQFDVDLTLLEP